MGSQAYEKFVSLRIKLTGMLVFVAIVAAAGFILMSMRQLDSQFQSAEKSKFDSLRRDFYYLIQLSATELNVFAEQISALNSGTENFEDFRILVEDSWDDLELLANINSLQFYEPNRTRPTLSLGSAASLVMLNLAQEAINGGEPKQQLNCERQCSLIVSTPVLTPNGRSAIVLEKSLFDILMALSQLNDVEVGLLSAFSTETSGAKNYLPNWRLRTSVLTNENVTFPFLSDVSAQTTLDQVIRQGAVLKKENVEYMVWAVPLTDLLNSSHYLLILDEVSETRAFINNHLTDSITAAVLAIFALSVMAIMLTNIPIKKVQRLLRQYDRIAKHEFELVKENLPRKDNRYPDEVDVLYRETVDLVDKLEVLDADVQKKTAELKHQAMHDELTGLGNRNLFMYELQKIVLNAQRTPKNWALIFFDLDKFKMVNDTLGHDVGDELLKLVAHRLTECLRNMDIVCRLGGDEFTVILNELKRREDINVVMDKIFSVMGQPAMLGGKQMTVGCSAGVIVCDENVDDADDALKAADMAMYESKRAGRNRYKIFDEEMSHSVQQNFMIENEFAEALMNDHFVLLLQPQIHVASGVLYGFEALIRWRHPKQGEILPANFIPILEESDRIIQLGRWVARRAIEMIAELSKIHKDVKIAINVSPKQIRDDSFVPLITEECFEKNVSPNQLVLELTESVLIEDIAGAKEWINFVQRKGFRLAIDDFGTGYSSLSYLSNLPFDIVKLDRTFVNHLSKSKNDRDILGSVINMVHKMNREIVAEGIEEAEQLAFLTQMECNAAQGYLIQYPTDFEDIVAVLERYPDNSAWPTVKSIVNMKYISGKKA